MSEKIVDSSADTIPKPSPSEDDSSGIWYGTGVDFETDMKKAREFFRIMRKMDGLED